MAEDEIEEEIAAATEDAAPGPAIPAGGDADAQEVDTDDELAEAAPDVTAAAEVDTDEELRRAEAPTASAPTVWCLWG